MPSIETVKVGRNTISYVALPMGPIPVAPAWTIHKGKLYIAAFPQVLQAAIENEGKDPLTASATFAKCRARVGKDVSMLSYVNTPKIISQVYNLILLGWTTGANVASSEGPFAMKPSWLPAMSVLARYMPPSISAVSSDRTGITFERHGWLPFGGLFGGLGPVGPAMVAALLRVEAPVGAREQEIRARMEREQLKLERPDRGGARPKRAPVRPNRDF